MMKARVILLSLALWLPVSAAAEPKPALTHAAMWLAERVGAPVVSPDGRWAVFGVTEPSYDSEQIRSDLWIVATDGSAPARRLTSTAGGESDPRWSPDGNQLAFVAKREGQESSQIWVLPMSGGGEARPVTEAPLGADSPRWSPDGSRLLFGSRGYPGAVGEGANEKARKERDEAPTHLAVYENFPIRRWDSWLDETRPRLYTIGLAEAWAHEPSDGPERLAEAEEKGGEEGETKAEEGDAVEEDDAPARDLLGASELASSVGFRGEWGRSSDGLSAVWTPEGDGVVFVATDQGHTAARAVVQTQLWWVSAGGGEPRRLTDGPSFSSPVFSPDGRWLCFSVVDYEGVLYDQGEIACAPWSGEPPAEGALAYEVLTEEIDRVVDGFVFASADPAGDGLYLTVYDAGHVDVWHSTFEGATRRVAEAETGVYGGLSTPDRSGGEPVLLGLWGSAASPHEVVRLDVGSGERSHLTRFNVDDAAQWDLPPLQEFWTEGPEGRRLHSFLVLPAGFDPSQRYPVLALIHGGHASMWRDAIHLRWNYHLLSQPGFVIVATDYRGSIGYGERFTLAIEGDPMKGPAEDVIAAVDDAVRRFPYLDGERVCAAGASYGGHIVNWLAGGSDRFDCLISHAGLASLEQQWLTSDVIFHREMMMGGPFWEDPQRWLEQSPILQAPGFDVPILMSIGVDDYRVPLNNTLAMWSALERMDTPNRLLVWQESNHWIMDPHDNRRFYEEFRKWLEQHLLEPEG